MISQRRICLDLNINSRPVTKFEGERIYVSTGDSDDMEKAEVVTFYNRPSRANVSPLINDVIFAKMADTDKTFLIDGVLNKYIYSTGFFDVSSTRILPRFLYYLIQSDEFNAYKNAYSEGTTQVAISDKRLKKIKITYETNKTNQQKITDYLDKKVGIIDRLIENINQQIEDLTKYKKSVVTEVITKGLKFGINMKEDHTGKIPEYWEITNLKNVLTGIKDGTHGSYQRVQDGEYLLSAKNVFEDGLHISSNDSYISEKDYKSIVANGYPAKDDILICCVGTIGRCCIYNYDKPFAFQRSVSFLRPNKKTNSRYLLYVLKSENVQSQLNQMANASAQAGIYMGILKTVKIPYCRNGSEQFRMVVHLDTKCKHIDMLTKIKQQKIVELKKYKKSLIYECVTGKKEIL